MISIIMSSNYIETIESAKTKLKQILKDEPVLSEPRVLIICGSGLGGIVNILKEPKIELEYEQIPGFKPSTVSGHSGKLVFGLIGSNKVPVMCMVGRLHYYEGYSFQETTFPIRLAKVMGVNSVMVTNAAGGVNDNYKVGDLMVLDDHINFVGFAGLNPLRGPNLDTFGPRFVPLSDVYNVDLRRLLFTKAKKDLKISRPIHEGVYLFTCGPTYETRAEVRMVKALGGDAVGMSTVPEVIVARHCDMRVLALSLITNIGVSERPIGAMDESQKSLNEGMANHKEVMEAANEASNDVQRIFEATVNEL